ncbi:MAG: methyltransferase [Rhodospirillaceae bacterium]|nr:methyltransferase [Rhodospirillaceae bacterium]
MLLPTSWTDRWLAIRNRLIASARFRRWAAGTPLVRRIAHRQTGALFDLVAGFVYAQVLYAGVRVKLFDHLAAGPLSIDEVARRTGLPPASAELLLSAAASLRLVEPAGQGRFALGMLGAALQAQPGVSAMIEHHALLYADLADPVALLRDDPAPRRLADFWAYARSADPAHVSDADVAAYSALMAASQSFIADDVLDAYPVARHEHLLDVGGGEGAFLIAAGRRAPDLRLSLFDLPAVAARATVALADAGLSARSDVIGGNFLRDPLPHGADLITLVRVLHDHGDAAATSILRAIHVALRDGGTLVIAEPMAGTDGAAPMGAAYFGFYLKAMGSGRPRTSEEIRRLLAEIGFRDARILATRTPLLVRVIAARK